MSSTCLSCEKELLGKNSICKECRKKMENGELFKKCILCDNMNKITDVKALRLKLYCDEHKIIMSRKRQRDRLKEKYIPHPRLGYQKVIELVKKGCTRNEIIKETGLSKWTVKNYLQKMRREGVYWKARIEIHYSIH